MFIQEIIVEGFKSYATRTVISGWDPEFNAITGLNGSGKSNILDAICFVLGIENLRQVRATTLQDLVYKRGQAGITKASVTIVFNNEQTEKSPVGFAEHQHITVTRQIVVGGKNKYLVNGHNAPPKVVENLFQSVQLNINNPHFLIMQGQITKVLNMKPPEILSMLEETAGTRMFEDRKLKALQTMCKKEKKVEEIEGLLADVIGPKLDALRREKTEYIEYKRTETEIEKLAKFLAAFDYHGCAAAKGKFEAELAEAQDEAESLDQEAKASKAELERVADQIMVVTKKKEKESKQSYKLRELEASVKEADTELIKLQTQAEIAKASLDEEAAELQALEQKIKKDEAQLEKDEKAFGQTQDEMNGKEAAFDALKGKVARDEELLRSLSTGISSSGQATGYDKIAEDIQNKISDAALKVQQSELRIRSLEEQIGAMKEDVAKARKDTSSGSKKSDVLRAEISQLAAEREAMVFDAAEEKALEDERRRLEGSLAGLKDRLDQLQGIVSSVSFSYTDPQPGFDRGAVKGVVAQLVSLPEASAKYANALEIAAGGRLYNVVVSDEHVANQLLEKGRLSRRVTIIPLSKIVAKPVPEDKARLAHDLTDGRARVGLTLVACDGDVLGAIKYVFGSSFVCDDKEAAAKVAFDRRIGSKAVTLDGDVYEPSGTLSGGSSSSGGSILTRLCEFKQAKAQHEQALAALATLKAQLEAVRAARRKRADIEQRAELKSHELKLLERQLAQNSAGRLILQYESMVSDVATLTQSISAHLQAKAEGDGELARIRAEVSEFSSNRDGKLRALEKDLAASKKLLAREAEVFEGLADRFLRAQTDLEIHRRSLEASRVDLERRARELEGLHEAHSRLQSDFFESQTRLVGLRVRYETEVQHLRQFDAELKMLELQRQQLATALEQAQMDRRRLQAQTSALIDAVQKCERQLHGLVAQHLWIKDQHGAFGAAGGPFDFAGQDMADCRKRLGAYQDQHQRLRKNINFNVMDMIDRIEAKETSLKQMMSTIKRDRTKIEETIGKLNDFKLEALSKTYRKVNEDFGLIFADLLPGSFAKLEPQEGQDIADGLEIKVQLGGVWKGSLTELSGGQRSVIALSLILSLLQFKPAPMYILDEVDAALDLSHTENIGRLFQTRFKGSQFIVVSLKEGMFSNANVLFKTKFRDGISSVERTQSSQRAAGKAQHPAPGKRHGITVPKRTIAA